MKGKIKKPLSCFLSFVLTALCFSSGYLPVKAAEDSAVAQKKDITFGPYVTNENDKQHAYEPFKEKQNSLKDKTSNDDKNNLKFRKDRILIKMNSSTLQGNGIKPRLSASDGGSELQDIFDTGVENVEPILQLSNSSSSIKLPSGKIIPKYKSNNADEGVWCRANLKKEGDVESTISKVLSVPGVISAEPDYLRNVEDIKMPDVSSDPQMAQQWYLNRCGIKDAWSYLGQQGINSGGSRDVVVAVLDTGVDINHSDLVGNIWTNSREIPDNGVDDDGNGFVDDVHGVCTVGNSYSGESGNPMDDNGHGTHVAGIIAGEANNGKGIAGVAYNVQIMPIKAAQSSGMLSASDVAQGIYYAADKGADVINMSFGGYGQSTIEEDALQTAFGSSVLVAAAGNDATPNLPHPYGQDMFPAAYPWVVGVMAENQQPAANGDNLASFSNWDYVPQDSHEYEVMAPGVEMLSTLPGEKYASWSGTSMAAPVVSGIAALLRSKFTDKGTYSSRFIMGQIISTGEMKQGITYSQNKPPEKYYEVNALNALTKTPKPDVSYLQHYIFDSKNIDSNNNEDGVVDAGETLDLAMVVRNHWGKADNVKVTIDTKSGADMADPYATLLTDTVDYGAVGNFAIDDNGLQYDTDGKVTRVSSPFKIKVADNTPNDHVIPINVTITAANGFDTGDKTPYTFSYSKAITLKVRNGQVLPGDIKQDMTLTKDKFWVIPNATIIEKGAKVTVEPGTQIQFWSSEPEDPYAEKTMAYLQVKGQFIVNGTEEEPVEMFASALYPGYEVKIYSTDSLGLWDSGPSVYQGNVELNYTKVMNPNLLVNKIDHCYFSQDLNDMMFKRRLYNGQVNTENYYGPRVYSQQVTHSIFYKLGYKHYDTDTDGMLKISGKSQGNLFDSCVYYLNSQYVENNVYLKNYKLSEQQWGDRTYWTSVGKDFGSVVNPDTAMKSIFPVKNNDNGSTYFAVIPNISYPSKQDEMKAVEAFAKKAGGHIATINDEKENNFISSYIANYLYNHDKLYTTYPDISNYYFERAAIGVDSFDTKGNVSWISGEDSTYTNWNIAQPDNKDRNNNSYTDTNNCFIAIDSYGKWSDEYNYSYPYIIEVSGTSYVKGITLDSHDLALGAGGASTKLSAVVTPDGASNKNLIWTSSDTSVVTVDSDGTVKPLKVGNAVITATTEDGSYTDKCNVIVKEIVKATGITIDKTELNMAVGQKILINATILPEESTDKNVIWTSSNISVATVDNKGNVTALAQGQSTITAASEDGGFTAQCSINVVVPVTGFSLDKGFLRLVIGNNPVTLNPKFQPDNATIKNIKWSSSDEKVATVDEIGKVTPVALGTALITAVTEDGGYSASTVVTVWDHDISYKATSVAVGSNFTYAINEDGTLWSWGNNENGALGNGTNTNYSVPIQVKNLTDVKKVSAGNNHAAALKSDGTLWTWGSNWCGQLGNENQYGNESIPKQVTNLSNITDIASGENFTAALKSDGTVWTWGYNYYGQLGDGSTTNRNTPVQVSNLNNVVALAASSNYMLALKSDGTVWSWGYNGSGQLGNGTNSNSSTPVQVSNLKDIKAISAGNSVSVALKNDGTIWGWGSIVGINGSVPIQKQGVDNVKAIAVGNNHVVALKNDSTVWSFGYNDRGQLGDGTNQYKYDFTQVTSLTDVVSISAGSQYTSAVKNDGTVWCFGANESGQLGNLSNTDSYIPVQTLFGILPDTTAPQTVSSSPQNNATNVFTNGKITIDYSEVVKAGDNFSMITLKDASNNTVSLKSKTFIGNKLIIEPISELSKNTLYTVNIPENAVKDMFGNSLPARYTFNFTTGTTALQNLTSGINKTRLLSSEDLPLSERPVPDQAAIEALRQDFTNSGNLSTIKNNAILNNWWDPNVNNWMRFISNEGSDKRYLANNYWGISSEDIIEKDIVHYNDFKNMEEVIYKPILTSAPEGCYPFVTDAYVSSETENKASKVGAENIKVNVLFNRDMNKDVQPQVSFGPDSPTTDYTVKGDWIDSRHWQGQFTITPLTGDGYQFIRVKGAQAADDAWLITGNDSERFRFEIVTSGTESMNLQASGGEGKISLSWSQDDFDTLAGYNVYRSEAVDGEYTKINTSIIPKDKNSYEDKDVQPGKSYFYKFTVVKTDMTESKFSNVAAASALDTISPVINHDIINAAVPGLSLQVYADVTDNVSVTEVNLYYRKSGATSYNKIAMTKTTGTRYSTTIEGSNMQSPGIEYYIEASDGISIIRNGSAREPNKVTISDNPKVISISPIEGSSNGGTEVIINGTNFKDGAKVAFDGVAASSVVVEGSNKIKAITPAHYPAIVNVTVTNKDGSSDTLFQAFKFKVDGVQVAIPNVQENKGHAFEVPINVESVSGLTAADISMSYDKDVLSFKGVRLGAITKDFSLTSNGLSLGTLKLSMASSKVVDGSGALVFVEFEVKSDTTKTTSSINLDDVKLNSGAITVNKSNGTFLIADTHTVSGSINYFNSYKPISLVNMILAGNKDYNAQTDISGNYKVYGIEEGAYTLTANKGDEIDGITAYDASLILQSSAGLANLDSNEKLAADVDGNGKVDSMDAAYVLKKAAELIEVPFPCGKQWIFNPSKLNFSSITSDISYQNLTGILVGDVSGSWKTSGDSTINNLSNVEFRFGEVQSGTDGSITVPLITNANNNKLYSTEFIIGYDSSKYSVVSVEKGDLCQNFIAESNLNTSGQIKIAMASANVLTDSGVMLNIKLKPLSSSKNVDVLGIIKAEVNEDTIKTKIIEYLFGDIDKDGKITIDDSNLLKDLLLGKGKNSLTEEQLKAADVDEDGKITSSDYALIRKMIIGKIVH